MNLTLNTDASYYQNGDKSIQLGGFAFWAKCSQFTYKGSGKIKEPKNPNDCELKAICNALYLLKKNMFIKSIEKLYINTDSQSAIRYITQKKNDDVTILIHGIIESFNVKELHVRHVKAHQHTKTKRNYVNQWCDDMAKIEMRKQKL